MINKVDSKYLIEGSSFFYFKTGDVVWLGSAYAIPPMVVHDAAGEPWVMLNPGERSAIKGKLLDALHDYMKGATV